MTMDIQALRAAAGTITFIPEHYELVMEDNTPKGFDENERTFIWEDPHSENSRIEVSLSLETGQLMRLQIDQERDDTIRGSAIEAGSTTEQAADIAKAFMIRHHPNYAALTWIRSEIKRNYVEIEFRAEVGGLPLPRSGCEIRLDADFNIVLYKAEEFPGMELPVWPDRLLVSAEAAKQRILQDMEMQPIITTLYPSIYDMEGEEDQHRLVYEPIQGRRKIDAVTGEPLHNLQHDLLPPTVSITPADPGNLDNAYTVKPVLPSRTGTEHSSPDEDSDLIPFWEAQLGIDTERYVLDKPRGDDQNLILLYFDKSDMNEDEADQSATDPLSVDRYFERRWGKTLRNLQAAYMIHIDKTTGRLEAYHYKPESSDGETVLTREQCWERAELFLQRFFPSYAKYLRLEVKWDWKDGVTNSEQEGDEGEAEKRDREFFHLPLYMDQYRVRLERVNICVSTMTGEVLQYRSVSHEKIRELEACGFKAAVSAASALARYAERLEMSLRWYMDGDDDTARYRLIYDPVYKRRAKTGVTVSEYFLEFIDAVSGELIWSQF